MSKFIKLFLVLSSVVISTRARECDDIARDLCKFKIDGNEFLKCIKIEKLRHCKSKSEAPVAKLDVPVKENPVLKKNIDCRKYGIEPNGSQGIFVSKIDLNLIAGSVEELACRLLSFDTIVLSQLFNISNWEGSDKVYWSTHEKVGKHFIEKRYGQLKTLISLLKSKRGKSIKIFYRLYTTSDHSLGVFPTPGKVNPYSCYSSQCPHFVSYLSKIKSELGGVANQIEGFFIDYANLNIIDKKSLLLQMKEIRKTFPAYRQLVNIVSLNNFNPDRKKPHLKVRDLEEFMTTGDEVYVQLSMEKLAKTNGKELKKVNEVFPLTMIISDKGYTPPFSYPTYVTSLSNINPKEDFKVAFNKGKLFENYKSLRSDFVKVNRGVYFKFSNSEPDMRRFQKDMAFVEYFRKFNKGILGGPDKFCSFIYSNFGHAGSESCMTKDSRAECNKSLRERIGSILSFTPKIIGTHEAKLGALSGEIKPCFFDLEAR